MKNYNPNIRDGVHTIKVSFQQWDYKGFVTFEKGGNCKGLDIIEISEDDLYDVNFKENPINFRSLSADSDCEEQFAMTLKNDKEELLVEDEWYGLSDYIVGIEIVDFIEEVG
ncbi:hypothetical protein D929_02219 [Enterococcus faecalis 02-MB-P-10]|uniref:DUF5406 family protein n=1 Tax=Enterococcus faecalis TaxID=1351 RepID=UPI000353F69C|nr:DUF5406 family protein [Enterococcus faecalis]EPH71005.1 hypothetical protein D929_02219 [Enterococcus faecalis 02-MB-P-10]